MMLSGTEVLDVLRDLKAYDQNENLLGVISGGTSNRKRDEPWTEQNTEAFVDGKEMQLNELFFKQSDIEEKLYNWKVHVHTIGLDMLMQEDIRGYGWRAKEIVDICKRSQLLTEYTENNEEKLLK